MYQTIRLDSKDVDKSKSVLKKYAKLHPETKYLLSPEGTTPEDGVKYHQQGWAYHTETQKSFSQYISRYFSDCAKSKKSLELLRKPPSYIPYIIHNDNKQPVRYDSLITNYTEEEFNELVNQYQWIERRQHKLKGKEPKKDYYTFVLDKLDELCVKDGKIQYQMLMSVYMNYVPKKVNARILYDNLLGYTVRLEYRYPQNKRARSSLYNQVARLDDEAGIFKTQLQDYIKMVEI